jgi:glucose-6-phosphate 1-dehydrogenase
MAGDTAAKGFRIDCEQGMERAKPEPCLMVIFGATGDLTRRSLLPSLFELALKDLLPERFAVLGVSRSEWDDEEFRRRMRDAVEEDCDFHEDTWKKLSECLHYEPGNVKSSDDFQTLEDRIGELRSIHDLPGNVLFHLATPPAFFGTIADGLSEAGLASSPEGWRRLVVEKPFGEDRASARDLHRQLGEAFHEEQIYRVDHFLGKETVQNMLVFRFANPSFEPVWSNRFIDHVQITVAEDMGIGTRAGFYESTGVVRDMLQNHLLQLLCMTAVEPPLRYDASSLRDETVKVLQAIRPPEGKHCVFGQYGAGDGEDGTMQGYRQEEGVGEDSATATFVAVRLELDNWRWAGVPFYLRTGKRMPRKLTEVAIQFKPTPHVMFDPEEERPQHRSVLAFRLQPEEGILQTFVAKQPGPRICLTPVSSSFHYADAFGIGQPPRAYAWLILDAMDGQQTLFAREDWVDRAWAVVDPVAQMAEAAGGEFPNYASGTPGPKAAEELLARDGRSWREL